MQSEVEKLEIHVSIQAQAKVQANFDQIQAH